MRFGSFDDKKREYVITTPQTPCPWINYLGTGDFFSLISNTAGGYCFYQDAYFRRILRYRYNNIPNDNNGRYFYIRENDDFWSPCWKPVKRGLTEYQCRHGLGYTIIKGVRNGLAVEVLYFVPIGNNCEIHRVSLTNTTDKVKKITLFSYVEFCLWTSINETDCIHKNFCTGEVEVDGSTIYHKTGYREQRNHFAFYTVNRPVTGFDTDRESFTGRYNGLDNPDVVTGGKSKNSITEGGAPIASHSLTLTLDPKDSTELVFILGYVENDKEDKWEVPGIINKKNARAIINTFQTSASVEKAIKELKNYWTDLLSVYTVKSSDEKLDRMVNIWNHYQCIITNNLFKSELYSNSGTCKSVGFRENNQLIAGFVHLQPMEARKRILALASALLEDNGVNIYCQPRAKKGEVKPVPDFNGDPLWLIYSVSSYIKETGDWSILEEIVPFHNDQSKAKPLLEHLTRTFNYVINNLGPHGLPLLGCTRSYSSLSSDIYSIPYENSSEVSADKDSRTAESILTGAIFVCIGSEYAAIIERLGMKKAAASAKVKIKEVADAVKKYGWDGEWFIRVYDNCGRKIGSNDNEEGKIFAEPQGYCVMAGIGIEDGMAEKALESVRKMLDTMHGLVSLTPAYTRYQDDVREFSSSPPGHKENAGIFCHSNPWIIIAETLLGQGDFAFDHYRKTAPAYREEICDVHRMEPYVYSQMIVGKDARQHGEAKNSWLTVAASWNFIAVSQWILGVRPLYNGLQIDPCIPS
ncbi:MAG: glycosyl transferase, partial [Fibrobacter sp.]|nr:glycosyl transferase [Fibrobacter sp.]